MNQQVNEFKKRGISFLHSLTESQLVTLVDECNDAFHSNQEPLLTDHQFDIVVEYMQQTYPQRPLKIGTDKIEKNKVPLPYEMASMNKIKPDTHSLDQWKHLYRGPYVLSCKLDGVSGMYCCKKKKGHLYTRGNGTVGQDVSHLIPYLRLPTFDISTVVRGEFIISKKGFKETYASRFSNSRNWVAGTVNRQTILPEQAKDVRFVCYEVIEPVLKPSQQLEFLQANGFETVSWWQSSSLTNEILSSSLLEKRETYEYDMDGIIVAQDSIFPRKTGNPEHAFAFKMVLTEQMAEAKVVDVLWTPSKDGYLKPRVQIEPVVLGGVQIEFATGFNAAFIQQNKIGVGAVIQLIRSGDVIPHIQKVTVPAVPKMPEVAYVWTESKIDILLKNKEENEIVREKMMVGFFKGINVDGLGEGNVVRLMQAGYDTIPKILSMKVEDFLKVDGFKAVLAKKLHDGIQQQVKEASLLQLMVASNLLGRGISEKKLISILDALGPEILVGSSSSSSSSSSLLQQVSSVKGMAEKSAQLFVQNMDKFVSFLKECGLEHKLYSNAIANANANAITNHVLNKKTVVVTGTRDETVLQLLRSVGAILGSSVSKQTFLVVCKSKEDTTGKIMDAKKNGVPLVTVEEFKQMYQEIQIKKNVLPSDYEEKNR
jgi:NAD-dependent DNA ligase